MTHDVPMLADFAARLAFGMTALLLLTSWRAVPLPFFRTQCQIILGLLVLAGLDHSRVAGISLGVGLLLACAVLAYGATVAWGLGLPTVALPATVLIALLSAGWLGLMSRTDPAGLWAFNALSRLVSGFLLGATLTAMLLGHHYLTAPTMSIQPLERSVAWIGWGLAARGLVALLGLSLSSWGLAGAGAGTATPDAGSLLLLLTRWGVGFAAVVVAVFLAWRTVRIRSTQSATGILYVAMTLLLFGELTSLIGSRLGGPIG